MLHTNKEIKLLELTDVEFLQKLQDEFAKAMGISSIIVDDKGLITKPSNFTDFCKKHIRVKDIAQDKCIKSNIAGSKLALKKGEPLIYKCHAGLTNFVVPIIVEGQHLASILGSQFFTEPPDEKIFHDLATKLKIEDKEKYIEDLKKIEVISEKKVESAVKLLSLVANTISEIAHKNYELIQKNQREKLTEKIIKKIRSTLDSDEVKKYFIDITQKYFEADRCIFANYDSINKKFLPFELEKLNSPDIESLIGVDLEEKFPEFCQKLRQGKDIIIKDLEKTLARKKLDYKAIKTLSEKQTKSDYGLLVKCKDQIVGILILHFIKEKRILTHDEVEFLKVIREHAGTALCQAELYEIIKKQAEREKLLIDVNNKVRNSLDFEKIKHEIVTQLGHILKADRVVIAYYDYKINNYNITKAGEYRSSDDVKPFRSIDFAETPGFTQYIRNIHFQGKDIIFNDLDKYLDDNNLRNTDVEKFYKNFGINSLAAINIYHEDTFLGNLVITFENKRNISEDEAAFLKSVADQAGIAFHQAELYQNTKELAEREQILRKITNQMHTSLNIEEVKKEIINQLKNLFKADRINITYYDEENNDFIVTENAEYLADDKMIPAKNVLFKDEPGFKKYVQKIHFEGKDIIFNDLDKYLDENNLRNTDIENFYRNFEFISAAAINISNEGKFLGNLVVAFKHPRDFSQSEISFLKSIAAQAGVALNQAELYEKEKENTKRETLLRNITENIRSSLNINDTTKSIVNEVGIALEADICTIAKYDIQKDLFYIDEYSEYRSSEDEITFIDHSSTELEYKWFNDNFKKNVILNFENVDDFINENNLNNTPEAKFLKESNVKSSYCNNIYYSDNLLGYIVIIYTKNYKKMNKKNKEFLSLIAAQIGTAIQQAKLHQRTQEAAKREILIRNITEAVRTSLDFDETKKKIVDIIGKTLNADRCLIIEYNKKSDKFLIPNEEYLSSNDILSYKGVDLNEHIPSLVLELKQGKRLILNEDGAILDNEKINLENESFEDIRNAETKYKVYSALVFPLFYFNDFLGDLVLHYVNVQHRIGEDEINFLNLISNQIALAFHQSKLYAKVQLQAERERISRNIIEILRSTLDKNLIEHLFVRNIGKFFKANRVFFSEFDSKEKKYMPIDEKSEYLSGPEEKSFVNYDFSGTEMGDYIAPIIEKRELIIPNWAKYIEENPKTEVLTNLYQDANVKSSYSFPVLYEEKRMGYFCIEFTKKINEFLDEDISRLRNICSQAGIALYHAELYMETQKALQSKGQLIYRVKSGIKKPVGDIIKSSKALSELELEHDKQRAYLNNILNSCNQLLELTKEISD